MIDYQAAVGRGFMQLSLDGVTIAQELTKKDVRLDGIVRRLIDLYRPDRIYLFGSKARGDFRPDSDYDLMVLLPDDAPPELREGRLAYEALWEMGVGADVLIWLRSDFERRAHVVASLPATILREGRLLYAA